MKKQTSNRLNELTVDALDYLFVEWLVRRSLYSKFSANLALSWSDPEEPRLIIRKLIRSNLGRPFYPLANLISGSFPFRCTPEGFHFWSRVSDEWASYLKSFSKTI